MNKRILITGSNGFVGKNLYNQLIAFYNVLGVSDNESEYTDRIMDVTNKEMVNKILDEINPEQIIHCAYYPHVEGCEANPEKAYKINIEGTKNIIEWCKKNRKKLIFLSTDYVYSINGDFLNKEDSNIGALNVYTQNKIDNEKEILNQLDNFIIIRTGFIYGYDKGGKNFLMQVIESEGHMEVPEDQIVNPTYINFLCEAIERMIELDSNGIFNMNGKESISRIDFARQIAEIFKLKNNPMGILTENINYKAKRPFYCKVDSSKVYEKTGIIPKMNKEYLEEIKKKIKEEDKKKIIYTRENCRGCCRKNLIKIISLGNVPIANSFLKDKSDLQKIPLDIYFCRDCYLIQIKDVVSPEYLFKDYRYASSVSKKVREHFSQLAGEIKKRFNLNKEDIILEVGSNDGVLIKELKELELNGIGIDPSVNITKIARRNGLPTINSFFNAEAVRKFVRKFGKAKIVTGSNVFAHIDNMDEVLKAIYEILEDDGTLIMEVHYLISQIENFQFDNFYHEHLCEYSVGAINNLLNRFNMEIYDVITIPIHGGSIRIFAKKENDFRQIQSSVKEILEYERQKGFYGEEKYLEFAKEIEKLKKDLIEKLNYFKNRGYKLAGYGASARGTILLNICNIDDKYLDYIVDNSIEKQGRYVPGVNIKIVPASHLKENTPHKILLVAYTYAKEIMTDEEWFTKQGGEFILPNMDLFDK